MPRKIALALLLAGLLYAGPPEAHAQGHGFPLHLAPSGYLGVGIMEVSPDKAREIGLVDPHGVEISSVAQHSPALRAGLEQGDIVLTYQDERVNGIEHFARLVRETPVGRTVELSIVRDADRLALDVEIGRRDGTSSVRETIDAVKEGLALDEGHMDSLRQHLDSVRQHLDSVHKRLRSGDARSGADFGTPLKRISDRRIGLELVDVDGQLAEFFGVDSGALVRSVLEGSPCDRAGMRAGDVIVGVDGTRVRGTADIRDAVLAIGSGGAAELELVRDRRTTKLELDVPRQ